MRIGLVADTHGYAGHDVQAALSGCDLVVHAGDVGEGVLERLGEIAPLVAVRGNNDTTGEAALLPEVALVDANGLRLAVVHRLADAPADDWDVLVYGHSHRAGATEDDGRVSLNPGAAGRRGFHRRRSVALLEVGGGAPTWRFVDLGPRRLAS